MYLHVVGQKGLPSLLRVEEEEEEQKVEEGGREREKSNKVFDCLKAMRDWIFILKRGCWLSWMDGWMGYRIYYLAVDFLNGVSDDESLG